MAKFFGGGSGSSAPGDKVSVDGADTTSGFLLAKIAAGAGITLAVLNPGGAEQLQITASIPAVTVAGTAPISVTGGPNYTVAIADISNASKGVAPAITVANGSLVANAGGTASSWSLLTTTNLDPAAGVKLSQLGQSGAIANQYPSWSGTAWIPTTPLNGPANPADNGAIPIANAGAFIYLADGSVGQALIATGAGTAPAWGSNFGATQLLTTGSFRANDATNGFFQVGTNTAGATIAAQSGNVRMPYGFVWKTRESTFLNDQTIMDMGVSNSTALTVGAGVATLFIGSTTTLLRLVGTLGVQIQSQGGTATYTFNSANFFTPINAGIQGLNSSSNLTISFADQPGNNLTSMGRLILKGMNATGTNSFAGPVQLIPGLGSGAGCQAGNIELFGSSGSAADNSMAFGVYMKDRTAAPVGSPTTSGLYHWSETGGLPTWRTMAGDVIGLTGALSATATGGAAAIPALPVGYFSINLAGTSRKVAYYAT